MITKRSSRRQRLLGFGLLLVFVILMGIFFARRQPPAPDKAESPELGYPWRSSYPRLITTQNLQLFYDSIVRQFWCPQTGLFLSFPDSGDPKLVQQAATYDQGVVGLLALRLGDKKRAKGIIDFYIQAWKQVSERRGKRQGIQGLANFYNAYFGNEGIEKTIHVGPNAWIGLLAARYARLYHSSEALDLAKKIAFWCLHDVPHREGAIAMGPIVWNWGPWPEIFSTENHMSYYAFLRELEQVRGLLPNEREAISNERAHVEQWLASKVWRPKEGRVLRGFNPQGEDRIEAIDSYTWIIEALGPTWMETHGMPVYGFLTRSQELFHAEVGELKGMDCVDAAEAKATFEVEWDKRMFRPKDNNHRLIWYEGTGQFIVAAQIVADHFLRKAQREQDPKAQERWSRVGRHALSMAKQYAEEIDKAQRITPVGVAYPCATPGRFYRWGWPAPAPSPEGPAATLAAICWRTFAGIGFEPFRNVDLQPWQSWRVRIPPDTVVQRPLSQIVLGASEEMTVKAWEFLQKKEWERAYLQAQAVIREWEGEAKYFAEKKQKELGALITLSEPTPNEINKAFEYGVMNDVAAAWFIIARCHDHWGSYGQAAEAIRKLAHQYPLAQIWDKGGWFWSPLESVRQEMIGAKPQTYGYLEREMPNVTIRSLQEAHLPQLTKNP